MTAPERVFMDGDIEIGDRYWTRCFETPKPCSEPVLVYVRADPHDDTKAQLVKAVEALKRIRDCTQPRCGHLTALANSVLAEIEKGIV